MRPSLKAKRTSLPAKKRQNRNQRDILIGKLLKENSELQTRIAKLESFFNALEPKLYESEVRVTQAELRAGRADIRCAEADIRSAEADIRSAEADRKAARSETLAHEAYVKASSLENKWLKIKRIVMFPLHLLKRSFEVSKKVFGKAKWVLLGRTKKTVKSIFFRMVAFIRTRPKIKQSIVFVLDRFPVLKKKLKNKILLSYISAENMQAPLSPRADHIYRTLRNNLMQQREEKQ